MVQTSSSFRYGATSNNSPVGAPSSSSGGGGGGAAGGGAVGSEAMPAMPAVSYGPARIDCCCLLHVV